MSEKSVLLADLDHGSCLHPKCHSSWIERAGGDHYRYYAKCMKNVKYVCDSRRKDY